ncbi:hypothetical protein VQ045_10695 [Aurantimonas sp. E1-2-R+4]|uniref:hypothetical protein n=1 Tax=Aurantimonas sp. E1-2-R+4 TaxID=3113714 RepID=UPI002F938E9C
MFVETVSSNSEDYEHDYGPSGETLTFHREEKRHWPASASRVRPDWLFSNTIEAEHEGRLGEALAELYRALDNDLHMLASIGIRTCFDIASEALGIDPRHTFKEKLKELVQTERIGPRENGAIEGRLP